MLHRDIKPENILLDQDMNIKLTDFGLAKEVKGDERFYECVGTPGYLAPEVLEAGMCERNECDGYSFEVDAWACGVVMYTLLVGTPPFWHHRQLNMIRLIMRGTYSMDGPAWSSVTAETKDLIRKLLVVNPKERLTIEQALQHEVFHAERFTRVGGQLFCVITEEVSDEDVESDADQTRDTNDNRVESASAAETTATATNSEPSNSRKKTLGLLNVVGPILSAKKLSRRRTSMVIVKEEKFNPRKAFKTAILCVRFLVRLKRANTTPVLLSLELTRTNPYVMKNYRHTIDKHAFGLYNHWIKKGQAQGQDRAVVFQTSPKRDRKKNKAKSLSA